MGKRRDHPLRRRAFDGVHGAPAHSRQLACRGPPANRPPHAADPASAPHRTRRRDVLLSRAVLAAAILVAMAGKRSALEGVRHELGNTTFVLAG